MVISVQAVAMIPKMSRDQSNSNSSDYEKPASFAQALKKAQEQNVERSYQTVTYGRDSQLHTNLYQSKEYTY